MTEEKPITVSNYIVAFIDILGQSQSLENLGGPNTDINHEKFLDLFRPAYISISRLRSTISDLQATFSNRKNPDWCNKLSSEQQKIYAKYRESKIQHNYLGDSVLIYISLQETEDKLNTPPLVGIVQILNICQILMLSMLAVEIPLRGGIDLGFCWETEQGSLYGQAISRAHYIESKEADYPRIVIHPRVIEYIQHLQRCSYENIIEEKMMKSFIDLAFGCISKDIDGEYIIHYLNPNMCNDHSKESFDSTTKDAIKFIYNSLKQFNDSNNKKLVRKYEKLSHYFHSNLVVTDLKGSDEANQ